MGSPKPKSSGVSLIWPRHEKIELPVGGCGGISSLKSLFPLRIVESGFPVLQKLKMTHGRSSVNTGSSIGVLHGNEDELSLAGSFVEDSSRIAVAVAFAIGMNVDHDGIPQSRRVLLGT